MKEFQPRYRMHATSVGAGLVAASAVLVLNLLPEVNYRSCGWPWSWHSEGGFINIQLVPRFLEALGDAAFGAAIALGVGLLCELWIRWCGRHNRPAFQCHLVTALCIILAIGVLTMANMIESKEANGGLERGWPWVYQTRDVRYREDVFEARYLFENVLVCFGTVLASAVALESLLMLKRVKKQG